jgi:ElaB/YqjD/DUF883 family membrane-anchored ribosome-binding protein
MKDGDAFARGKMERDFMAMIADTEALLRATEEEANDTIKAARARVEGSLASAKTQAEGLETLAADGANAAVKATDKYVHENPWVVIGIAAGVGLIAGWALGRK